MIGKHTGSGTVPRRAPTPQESSVLTDQAGIARSRVRFLTADALPPRTVRDPILASWQRSHQHRVAADRIEMSYAGDLPLDTRLTRSAEPVLRSLQEQLEGQSVSVILTDPSGVVLRRLTGDGDLERHLDRVLLAPGFSYSEEVVGTNGIGTALEIGGPAHVFGHEHYAENLEELACAAVPIHHPISGRLVGAVDLTCWRRDAGALLLTLAKTTAEQIKQALLADVGADELGLFSEYLRTCSRRNGVVFALNGNLVIFNDYARTMLDPVDQNVLLAQAAEALSPGHHKSLVVDLPTGLTARMYCRAVQFGEQPAGVVVHVKLEQGADRVIRESELRPRMALPGLVGAAPSWVHVCREVERIFTSGDWLALEGEPGSGKLALLKAVQLRRQPVGRFELLDAADAAGDKQWLAQASTATTDADTLVVQHVDQLDDRATRALTSVLRSAHERRERPLWVAVTLARDSTGSRDLQGLLGLFPSTLEVPPLRLHLEDLELLVPLFLSRTSHGGKLVCSPEAMRMLRRMSWPGNAAQVHAVLREVAKHRRTGRIEPEDLPPELHAVSRRVLSSLESMQRDAIVRCLADAGGNKVKAAKSLGMSRATIYRKIHDYGILPPSA